MEKAKKNAALAFSCAAVLGLACIGIFGANKAALTVCASMEETESVVKVFIGDTDNAPVGYADQRSSYVNFLADSNSDEAVEAIIGFDDYYTVDAVTAWAEDYDITINRLYMWTKGETGRLSIYVENGDVESSMETYKQEVEEDGSCKNPQFAADHQRFLDGEYEVFALTVTASAETLEAMNAEADCISYIDVMYNAEAETYAIKAGKTVSYIELPSKPDGAL